MSNLLSVPMHGADSNSSKISTAFVKMVLSSKEKSTNCPPIEILAQSVNSGETIAPELADHIESCLECQTQLDLITSGPEMLGHYRKWNVLAAETVDRIAFETAGSDVSKSLHLNDKAIVHTPSPLVEPLMPDFNYENLGSYRILRKLGEGGMGQVFEAEDTLLKRRVALKVMKTRASSKSDYRRRFLNEARAAAKVTHDNICPIYQVGEDRGIPFIAMPILQGETLETRLRRQGLALDEVLQVLRQSAEGAAAAHAAGLIHRDIKPSNIWLEDRPNGDFRVRILDFGLARCEIEDQHLTLSGTILGTPAYMAPEQARGEQIDQRADLFSLGAVAYEMITGKRAFFGDTAVEVLSHILTDEPAAIEHNTTNVPESLVDLVKCLLRKSALSRVKTASELVERIASIEEELKEAPIEGRKRQSHLVHGVWRSPAAILLVTAGIIAILAYSITLLVRTRNGTLVAEFDECSDLRVKNGQLQVHDERGQLRYTLRPQTNQQQLAPGKYRVQVTGADGLSVDTDAFELKSGENITLRVTAQPSNVTQTPTTSRPSPPATSAVLFAGKPIIREFFDNPERSELSIYLAADETKSVSEGILSMTKNVGAPREKLVLPIVKLEAQVQAVGFVTQLRAVNGNPFVNFSIRQNSKQSSFLSFIIRDGMWQLYLARQDLQSDEWETSPAKLLAFENTVDPLLMLENWVELAGRWNADEFDLWLNGKHIAGGKLPADSLPGKNTALQFCVGSLGAGQATMELASLQVWDQTEVLPENSGPQGLPPRLP